MLRNRWPASSGIGRQNQSEWVAGFARNRRPESSGIRSKQISKRIPSTRRQAGDPIYENKWSFNYGLEWKINEQAVIDESKTDGLFPLITNNHLLDAGEVLRMYKRQAYLEKRMYTKKSILDVAPVFLKKERRIEAVLLLYFLALMIVSLIERHIRLNMKKQKIEKLPILPQKMNTKKSTCNNIR